MSSNDSKPAETGEGGEKNHQGSFVPAPGKIDKRTGDPEAGGKTSGQKAADTRAERYGEQIHYDKK